MIAPRCRRGVNETTPAGRAGGCFSADRGCEFRSAPDGGRAADMAHGRSIDGPLMCCEDQLQQWRRHEREPPRPMNDREQQVRERVLYLGGGGTPPRTCGDPLDNGGDSNGSIELSQSI
jgi:hypothetical protein